VLQPISENFLNRFSGIARLYGKPGLEKLYRSHVAVIGIGGVGSWIVEALARSGIGEITLVDFDDVCTSNFNRQILATDATVGRFKIEVMGERILSINKECRVHLLNERFSADTANSFLAKNYDYIIDAFDNGPGKAFLAHHCRQNKKKLIVLGSVGGKRDPSKIKIDDLSRSTEDSLLSFVRKKLRTEYGFPRNKKFFIPCVYSTEKYTYPDESCSVVEGASDLLKRLDCGGGMGAITHLAGAFGFFAVSRVLEELSAEGTE
jgi:tRNA A37 threonylcarbamoyladenosine dehydratase